MRCGKCGQFMKAVAGRWLKQVWKMCKGMFSEGEMSKMVWCNKCCDKFMKSLD